MLRKHSLEMLRGPYGMVGTEPGCMHALLYYLSFLVSFCWCLERHQQPGANPTVIGSAWAHDPMSITSAHKHMTPNETVKNRGRYTLFGSWEVPPEQ